MYHPSVLQESSKDIITRMLTAYSITTPKELGDKLNKSKQAVQNASSRSVPSEWVLQASMETGRDVSWILTGKVGRHKDTTHLSTNRHMQDIARWINEQGDGEKYWGWVSLEMESRFPEFREYLKKTARGLW